jgi:hypothetical protein
VWVVDPVVVVAYEELEKCIPCVSSKVSARCAPKALAVSRARRSPYPEVCKLQIFKYFFSRGSNTRHCR